MSNPSILTETQFLSPNLNCVNLNKAMQATFFRAPMTGK